MIRYPIFTPRSPGSGFTLIEVMLTTVIIALVSVMLYQVFFVLLDISTTFRVSLAAMPLVDEKLWRVKNSLTRTNTFSEVPAKGIVRLGGTDVEWEVDRIIVDALKHIYCVNAAASWRVGSRGHSISRTALAMYNEKK